MTLMPVSNISAEGSSVSKAGAGRWISQRSSTSPSSSDVMSSGSPITLNTWPSTSSPTGTVMPAPVLRTGVPRRQAVGRLQADGPDAGVADLLGDLGADLDGLAVDRRRPWRGAC